MHGDLYFLLHKNIPHIMLFDLKEYIKKFVGRKKRYNPEKRAQNRLIIQHANFDQENNNSTNALRPRRFKWCNLPPNVI